MPQWVLKATARRVFALLLSLCYLAPAAIAVANQTGPAMACCKRGSRHKCCKRSSHSDSPAFQSTKSCPNTCGSVTLAAGSAAPAVFQSLVHHFEAASLFTDFNRFVVHLSGVDLTRYQRPPPGILNAQA